MNERETDEHFAALEKTFKAVTDPATQAAREAAIAVHEPWMAEVAPKVVPPPWRLAIVGDDGNLYINTMTGAKAIVSGERALDGKRWLHLSLSRPRHVPTWEELRDAKDLFVGKDKTAYSVLPAADRYVNIHARCLHLWHCLDGDPLPDFTRGGKSI